MNEKTLSGLSKLHNIVRLSLLASLVFFVIGLFALVSHWDSAVLIIIAACLFRLVAVGLARRKYNAEWMKASSKAAAERQCGPVSYDARETAPDTLVTDLGFAPDVQLTPNTLLFHVIRGNMSDCSFRLAETAFVRLSGKRKTPGSKSVAGTLITVENALPEDEKWAFLINHSLEGICPMIEYDRSTWKPVDVSCPGAVCFSANGKTDSLETVSAVIRSKLSKQDAALAAEGGKLSLMLPGVYYARKADITKAPTETMLNGISIPVLDLMKEILDKLRKP